MLDCGVVEITIMVIITGMENGDGDEHEEIFCKYFSKFLNVDKIFFCLDGAQVYLIPVWPLSTTSTCLVTKQINV